MTIARPTTLSDALDALADRPDAHLLAGGTDLMVEVNMGHRRPEAIVALRRVDSLGGHATDDDRLHLGSTLTYAQVEADLRDLAPGLAMASRTVGSPQIRNLGTIGGNLATASPAGDTLPWLIALDALVHIEGPDGQRATSLADFITGPKRTTLDSGEIILGTSVPLVKGPQHVAKVGPRSAMAISIASLAMVVDTTNHRVRVALGSVGPTPLRPTTAEDTISARMDWSALICQEDDITDFAAAVAEAAMPITDHRSTADYRRHTIGVLAARTLRRLIAA